MLDAIRPWFQIFLGALFLVPLVLRRSNGWLGNPLRRSAHPVRFWIMLVVGLLFVASGIGVLISG